MQDNGTKATLLAQRRYDRQACTYDLREAPMELLFRRWRRRLWSSVAPSALVMEIGAGTGKNLPFYPPDTQVVACDLSPGMLARYRRRHSMSSAKPSLVLMDAQRLAIRDASIDEAVGTFVFCSVPDPVLGLTELRRVLKPEGRLLLLEHVRSNIPLVGSCMDLANGASLRLTGANINRDTVANVRQAGFRVLEERNLLLDIVKLIVATPDSAERPATEVKGERW